MKQYKSKLKEWRFEKNIKGNVMRAIVRKDRKRKAEDPLRETTFRLREQPVPTEKIERYRRDHGFTEDTIMSDAGTPISNARRVTALDNLLNVATPSDISCETPVPVAAHDHQSPSQVEHQAMNLHDAYMQSTSPPPTPDPAREALTAPAVNIPEEIISRSPSPIVSPALASLNMDGVRRYSLYVELLQPLMTQLRKHGLLSLLIGPNGSPADFYRHGFVDYFQEFRYLDHTPWEFAQPSTSTGSGLYVSSSFEFWSSSLVSRPKVEDTTISIGGEGLRPYAGKDGLVTQFAKLDSFMSGIITENLEVWSCIGRSGLSQFHRQARVAFGCENYRAALGRRPCSCFLCLMLLMLLSFYSIIEASQLYAVAEVLGYTVDDFCLKVFVERTEISSEHHSAVAKLHQRLPTSWGLHWVYEPVSPDSDDP